MLAANAMSSAPPLSVILINQNGGAQLAATVASIREQRLPPELIVVDCGSSDESRAWLEAHRETAGAVVRAEGASFYAAANRGIAQARGEWVLFLRPGDRLVGDTVLGETLNWMRKTEAGVVAGEVAYDDGRLQKLHSRPNPIAGNFVPDSATFYRRSLFGENGDFDSTLPTMAGYDFNLRLWKSRIRFKPIPLRIVASRQRETFTWTMCREAMRVRHRYFNLWRSGFADVASALRALRPARRTA